METLADGFGLIEGPRPLADGAVLFSDVTGGGVYRLDRSGRVETVLERRRGIGGLVPHADGGVVVSGRDLAYGERTVMAAPEGATGFNDLTTTDDGGLLAGALRFNPMAGEEPVPGDVWRVSPDGASELFADGILWPNGIGLSPAGDVVYVSDFAAREVLAFGPDRTRFATIAEGNPDGLAVDAEGGVWVALGPAGAVARYAPDGELVERLDTGASFVSSVAFQPGGALLVSTVGALLRAEVGLEGRPVATARVVG